MTKQDSSTVDLTPAPRQGRLLRWSIRILFMLLVSLTGRAILMQPDVAAQVEIGMAVLQDRISREETVDATEQPGETSKPAVRAMPQSRVPVLKLGGSG